MSDSLFYSMKSKLLLNKVGSSSPAPMTVDVLSKSPLLELVRSKFKSDIESRELSSYVNSTFFKKSIQNLIYSVMASSFGKKKLNELMGNLNNLERDDGSLRYNDDNIWIMQLYRRDIHLAMKYWKRLCEKITSKKEEDLEFAQTWAGVSFGSKNSGDISSRIHKMYYSFDFPEMNMADSVIYFGNVVLKSLRLLGNSVVNEDISYFSLKIPYSIFDAVKHNDVLVIHMNSEEDFNYIKPKIDKIIGDLASNPEGLKIKIEEDGEKRTDFIDHTQNFGSFSYGANRRKNRLRTDFGHDIVSSDSSDFSEVLSAMITKEDHNFMTILKEMAQTIDSTPKFENEEDERIFVGDSIASIASRIAFETAMFLDEWANMDYDEKKAILERYKIKPFGRR